MYVLNLFCINTQQRTACDYRLTNRLNLESSK